MTKASSLFGILFMLITVSFWMSCQKQNDNPEVKMVPVNYYLSEEDESLLDYYYDYPSITFVDQDSNELIFTTDSLYRITMKEESNLSDGEVLGMRYYCQTDYFPNYSYWTSIEAQPNDEVELNTIFGTGTHWNDRHNDYILSWFTIDPKNPTNVDTVTSAGYHRKYDFHDSLALGSETFYNVFHIINEPGFNNSFKQTTDCYYSNDLGVVAFENRDERFWVRRK